MNHQPALDQHRAIFLATIDFLLQNASRRVIVDNDDALARYYENMQLKGEKHYRAGNLKLLQRVMRELNVMPELAKDDNYITFMKERTGYDEETIKQTIPAALPDKIKTVFVNPTDVTHKILAEKYSPDNKRKIIVRETNILNHSVTTYIDIQFERSGTSVYIVEGDNLDINSYWKDNNTIIIETRKEYVAKSKHGEQYQSFDDVVKVQYVVR
ncbi:MAG TPA: hypothetical protein VIM79_19500 [Niastella sp.]